MGDGELRTRSGEPFDPSVIDDWPREQLARLHVTCCIMELRRVGLVGGGGFEAGPNLAPVWRRLRASGFEPLPCEVEDALGTIPLQIDPEDRAKFAFMIEHFDEAMGCAQDLAAERAAVRWYARPRWVRWLVNQWRKRT